MADETKFYCQELSCNGTVLEASWDVPGAESKERLACPTCGWSCMLDVAKRFNAKRPAHHKLSGTAEADLAERGAPGLSAEDQAYADLAVNPDNEAEALRQRVIALERQLAAAEAKKPVSKGASASEKAAKDRAKAKVAADAKGPQGTHGTSGVPGLRPGAPEDDPEANAAGPNPGSSASWSSGPGTGSGYGR